MSAPNTVEALRQAALAADDAWTAALRARYGSRAGEARYDRRGRVSPELEALYQAKVVADAAWLASSQTSRT